MTKEEFYNDILKIYKEKKHINRKVLENSIHDYNVGWQLSKYGGLKNICSEIGIEYRQYSKLNDDDLLKDISRVYKENGNISKDIYDKCGIYSTNAIYYHFGGFNNALTMLNLPINMYKNVSKNDIIKDFNIFFNTYHSTSSTLYRKHGKYSQSTIDNLFGSWVKFIKYIGLKPLCEKTGKERMLEDVVDLYNEIGFLSAKAISDNCSFSYNALSNYYSIDEISKHCGCENAFLSFESAGSKMLFKILLDIYGEGNVIKEYTNQYLINNVTGKHLYVDYVILDKNIAFEYDGEQHYKFIPFIHKMYKNFFNQVYRDRLKDRILEENGFSIIRIKFNEKLTVDYLKERILSI